MPRRRSWGAKLAHGLGQGLQQVSETYMRQQLADQQNERIMQRQAAAELNRFITSVQEDVTKGLISPEQAAQSISVKIGKPVQPSVLRGLQPPLMQRKPMQTIGEQVLRADSPAEVPDINTMFRGASESGAPNVAGLMDMASRGGIDLESLLAEAPLDVQAVTRGATAKRRALTEQPTGTTTRQLPGGAEELVPVSMYNMQPMAVKPAARVQGQIAGEKMLGERDVVTPQLEGTYLGEKEKAQLGAVGGARAQQAGAEAGAREAAVLTPEFMSKRVSEATRKAYGSEAAQINARRDNVQAILDVEYKKAEQNLQFIPQETERREYAQELHASKKASDEGLMAVNDLRKLYNRAKDKMRAMDSTLLAQIQQGLTPRGGLDADVRAYMDAVEYYKPKLARSVGQVGNFTETEQARAGLAAPDFVDTAAGQGDAKLDRLEALFMMGPNIATMRQPGMPQLQGPARLEEINRRLQAAQLMLQQQRRTIGTGPQAGELRLDPSGLRLQR